jgi:hypothetical protein
MKSKGHLLLGIVVLTIFTMVGGIWSPALAKEDTISYFKVVFQEPADVFQGNGGVFMVSSNYTGSAGIKRIDPNNKFPSSKLVFVNRWIEFNIYDSKGVAFPTLWGLNYVYFNLNSSSRKLLDAGDLNIYRWDTSRSEWVECPTLLVDNENEPHGRAACVMTRFGLFGLAYEK